MVQDEAAHAGIGANIWQGMKKIPTDPLDAERQVGGALDQVESGHGGGGERDLDFAAQVALAGADFNDPGWGRGLCFKLSHDPSRVAEVKVDPPQIPAAPNCSGICRVQGIQNLGNDDTIQFTHWLQ
jgi:hypothetical protein